MRTSARQVTTTTLLLILALLAGALGIAGSASAQLGRPDGTIPIEDALKYAETGDYFVVEGVVVKIQGKDLYTLEDDTGEILVRIPNFVRRERGTPKRNERIRVSGKFDHKKLDPSTQGMRVQEMHRLGTVSGGRGEARGAPQPVPLATTPAAPRPDSATPQVVQPGISRDLVEQLRAKRREFDASKKELEEAEVAYGRALHDAGRSGTVDPAVRERLERAEKQIGAVRREIEPLLEEARRQGVAESTLRRYDEMVGGGH